MLVYIPGNRRTEKGRHGVELEEDGRQLSLKPENLKLVAAAASVREGGAARELPDAIAQAAVDGDTMAAVSWLDGCAALYL